MLCDATCIKANLDWCTVRCLDSSYPMVKKNTCREFLSYQWFSFLMWVLSTKGFARKNINLPIFYYFNSLLVFYLYYYRNLLAFVVYNVFSCLHLIYSVRLSCRRYYPTSQTLVLWLIQCFYTLFHKIHWILGVELFCGCNNWYWASDEQIFFVFWSVMNLCYSIHLLQKEASLMKSWGSYHYANVSILIFKITVFENSKSRFSSRVYDTCNHRYFASFTL